MSYSIAIPAEPGAHCTAESYDQTAEQALDTYFANWADGEQKLASRRAAEQAAEAVAALVDPPGIVGDTFRVTITGHAPDAVNIDLARVTPG